VGWGQRATLPWDAGRRAHRTERSLLPGRYQYKLIFDGRWSYDADHPLLEVIGFAAAELPVLAHVNMLLSSGCRSCAQDGGNVNNFIDVPRDPAHAAECKRCAEAWLSPFCT
jgi:hypothetical protein